MIRLMGTGLLALVALMSCASRAGTLAEDFDNPPANRGAFAWWHWCGGNVSKAGITRDLEAMRSAGLAGATIFFIDSLSSPVMASSEMSNALDPDLKFRSPRWWELLEFAAAECRRLGLRLGYCNGAGYSCSGGPWITPETSMKKLVWTKAPKGTRPAQPETVRGFYRDIAEIAVGDETYRFGYTTTGKCIHPAPAEIATTGLEADKMSAAAMNLHWDHAIDEIVRRIPASDPGLSYVMMDSYEAGDHDWTDDFRAEFRTRRGYDPVPLLPTLAGANVSNAVSAAQFRADMRQTKHELLTENHYRLFARRAHAAGLEMHLEPYYGDFDAMEAARTADVVMTEFWSFPVSWAPDPERFGGDVWHCGPVARAQGRTILGAESFTAMPMDDAWSVAPRHLKRQTDATFARGVNRLSLHHWVHQPFDPKYAPGNTMGHWGVHFGDCQTWFEPGKAFYRYLQRCQALLQRGEQIVDTLAINEGANEGETVDAVTKAEFLADAVKVEADGRLRLASGRTYRWLRRPWSYEPSDEISARIDGLVARGARLWTPEARRDAAFRVVAGDPEHRVLATARRDGAAEFFFVDNSATNAQDFVASFRVCGKVPEIWWPDTGVREPARGWRTAEGRTELPLSLGPTRSCFVVFERSSDGVTPPAALPPPREVARRELSGPWQVRFQAGRGAPEGDVAFPSLRDWSCDDWPGIRHFSGTADYEIVFTAEPPKAGERVRLDLGEVCDIAEVTLNGKPLGVLWYAPFAVDVTDVLVAGENRLTVRVTNGWANRLIGDESLPDDAEWKPGDEMLGADQKMHPAGMALARLPEWLLKGEARPSGRLAFSTWNYFTATSPLRPSGLIGPVRLSTLTAF